MNGIILGTIGLWQFVIIALVIVLLFGSAKIPELMRNLGKGNSRRKNNPSGRAAFLPCIFFGFFLPQAVVAGCLFPDGSTDAEFFLLPPFLNVREQFWLCTGAFKKCGKKYEMGYAPR